jgi:hypothetical protein
MHSRRSFLAYLAAAFGSLSTLGKLADAAQSARIDFQGEEVFERIVRTAIAGDWQLVPIGDLIGKIAREFENTPYVAKTLEKSIDREICSANLTGLDCVTFFETSLAFARMLKIGKRSPADLLQEIQFMRYRNGVIGDFTSRLHYTSDWFMDNQRKGVVRLLTDLPGAEPLGLSVSVMSSQPHLYPQLTAHAELIDKIKQQETAINAYKVLYVPTTKLAEAEKELKTGDIVALCTSLPGEDVSHTGLIYCTPDGTRHFMDASSRKENMKVTIEPGALSQRISSSKNVIGAMFARPLEPNK